MRHKRYLWFVMGVLLAAAVLWLGWVWFPSASEPGYRFVQAWGSRGSGPGEFENPIGIALSKDRVFVSDSGNHRIQVFDKQGHFIRQFGQEGSALGELSRPMHIDIRDDRLYVAEYLNDRIQIFSREGESLEAIGESGTRPGQFDAPGGVAVAQDG